MILKGIILIWKRESYRVTCSLRFYSIAVIVYKSCQAPELFSFFLCVREHYTLFSKKGGWGAMRASGGDGARAG